MPDFYLADKPVMKALTNLYVYERKSLSSYLRVFFITLLGASLAFNLGCKLNDDSIQGSVSGDSGPDPIEYVGGSGALTVTAMYPTFGANWNDYITRDRTKKLYAQAEAACVPGGVGSRYYKCHHGGELRKVIVPAASCDNLSLTDSLGVFKWKCAKVASEVFFYSYDFVLDKGLKNLINPTGTGFEPIKVTLNKNASFFADSASSTNWWGNNVISITLNSGAADPIIILNTPGDINVITASGASRGIQINNSKIALVMLPGVTLSNTASLLITAETNTSGAKCLVAVDPSQDKLAYIWFEGNFNNTFAANYYDTTLLLDDDTFFSEGNYFIRVHATDIIGNNQFGISIGMDSRSLKITNTHITNTHAAIHTGGLSGTVGSLFQNIDFDDVLAGTFGGLQYNTFHNITVNTASSGGLGGAFSRNNIFSNIRVSSTDRALNLYEGNKLANILVTGSGLNSINNPMNLTYDGYSLKNISVINSTNAANVTALTVGGIFGAGGVSSLSNIFVANSPIGLIVRDSNLTASNIVSVNNNEGIKVYSNSTFSGVLALNNTTNCTYSGAPATPAFTGANCDNANASTATRTLAVDVSNYFVGKSTDTTNAHSSGFQAFASLTDWGNFDFFHRTWVKDFAGTFPTGTADRGKCSAGNCQIFDWRLKAATAPLALNVNGTFTNGAVCPSSIHGDQISVSGSTIEYSLKNATEVMFDDIGDDDTLCETGETCVFSPNIGAYQGEGDYNTKSCVFQDGVLTNGVTGVTMLAYPTNGI